MNGGATEFRRGKLEVPAYPTASLFTLLDLDYFKLDFYALMGVVDRSHG